MFKVLTNAHIHKLADFIVTDEWRIFFRTQHFIEVKKTENTTSVFVYHKNLEEETVKKDEL